MVLVIVDQQACNDSNGLTCSPCCACRPLLSVADGGLQESVLEILRALLDPSSFTQKVGPHMRC